MAESPILVDSSIWIEGLRPRPARAVRPTLKILLDGNQAVITEMIRLEVLVGARSHEEFSAFRSDFEAIRCLSATSNEWKRAEDLSVVLGRVGLRVPPSDLLIAAVAISHDIPL